MDVWWRTSQFTNKRPQHPYAVLVINLYAFSDFPKPIAKKWLSHRCASLRNTLSGTKVLNDVQIRNSFAVKIAVRREFEYLSSLLWLVVSWCSDCWHVVGVNPEISQNV